MNSIVEDERKSIAIEIHDELNASLIAARLESQSILHLVSKAGTGAKPSKKSNSSRKPSPSSRSTCTQAVGAWCAVCGRKCWTCSACTARSKK
ncbi:histidine kinase dimerization/phosphoacceptor domain-containing protein [Massilia sp. B-10]|nr:histidine kinase dimerization/phosphoacceptor domain-containing protein [Massilia sp. B-10]